MSNQYFSESHIQNYHSDLVKAFNGREITTDEFEKAIKNLSKLVRKQITDKNGKRTTVYVSTNQEGKETEFNEGDDVKFSHKGKDNLKGKVSKLTYSEKYDKFGTAYIIDENGIKYSKSLLKLEKIKGATPDQAVEILNNVTPETRAGAAVLLTGKPEGEKSVGENLDNGLFEDFKPKKTDVIARSGIVVPGALDYTGYKPYYMQLPNPDTILNTPKPPYIPDINEKQFQGTRDDHFVLDYVKLGDGNFLVALNGHKTQLDKEQRLRQSSLDVPDEYAVMNLDNLVLTTQYYIAKRKAELEIENKISEEKSKDLLRKLPPDKLDYYKPFAYSRLSATQKKKYTPEQWEALSFEEKVQESPNMTKPLYSKSIKKVKQLPSDRMLHSNFRMYKEFVDPKYLVPLRTYSFTDPAAMEYGEARKDIKQKVADLSMQREENLFSYQKGLETSWGESNTSDILLKKMGVKVKTQNGSEITPIQVDQIEKELTSVFQSFGNRKTMCEKYNLKISHAANKMMFASSKAIGMYIPSFHTIGVSDKIGKFGFTLGHEFAHFMDNYLGRKQGNHYASDDYNSTAGKIAKEYRNNLNKTSNSDYINRTCECFARAFEQYHAFNTVGEKAEYDPRDGKTYAEGENYVSVTKFNEKIKPLIDQFFKENEDLLKGLFKFDIIG